MDKIVYKIIRDESSRTRGFVIIDETSKIVSMEYETEDFAYAELLRLTAELMKEKAEEAWKTGGQTAIRYEVKNNCARCFYEAF